MERKKRKEWMDKINEQLTLKMFRVGCDKTNFKIINKLPTTVYQLQKEINLTKMPMNRRINELEEVGLLIRKKYEGIVEESNLTKKFIKGVNKFKSKVKINLFSLI